ncbi:hypothetical protein LCGC14_1649960 [marine sediment metagenome]|uniref:Uncharacterized protein n=1 Tax=marine sediment metagenome TaxID=412755 RepID=A0A0F9HX18_9ZZZZ
MAQQNVLAKVNIALLGVIVSILLAAIPFAIDLQGRIIRIETKMEAAGDTTLILNAHESRIVRLEERSRRGN